MRMPKLYFLQYIHSNWSHPIIGLKFSHGSLCYYLLQLHETYTSIRNYTTTVVIQSGKWQDFSGSFDTNHANSARLSSLDTCSLSHSTHLITYMYIMYICKLKYS